MKLKYIWYLLCFSMFLLSCGGDKNASTVLKPTGPPAKIPPFSADSAYAYLEKQLSFGPRNPGSPGHVACKDWMVSTFESFGADVIAQNFDAHIYTGDSFEAWNIIAQFNPKHKRRVILSAHWDTRFIGEEDKDSEKKNQPIPGADDGGSGTAVLIEIARLLQQNPIDLGVDIILWDAEDQGKRGPNSPNNLWCLGSQHWSNKKHKKNYSAMYGINLDMIGGKNPRFPKEHFSKRFAGQLLDKVWALAGGMGHSKIFDNTEFGQITDDHYFVNVEGGIPMIDIINMPNGSPTNSFIKEWHTHDDDIDAIDKRSLGIVGQVVTAVIFRESTGHF